MKTTRKKRPKLAKTPSAKEFYKQHMNNLHDGFFYKMMDDYANSKVIAHLEMHLEHPDKPGYKRRDIVYTINQLKKNSTDEI